MVKSNGLGFALPASYSSERAQPTCSSLAVCGKCQEDICTGPGLVRQARRPATGPRGHWPRSTNPPLEWRALREHDTAPPLPRAPRNRKGRSVRRLPAGACRDGRGARVCLWTVGPGEVRWLASRPALTARCLACRWGKPRRTPHEAGGCSAQTPRTSGDLRNAGGQLPPNPHFKSLGICTY
ncbi:hypothetical protein AAFF_G00154260 [Aldrovandia affinis]|uniref:Uncharacterized protein n=1 Tax=Aldrovandia affinis TaxID=143900 RepID=A0AAD7SZW6_9TELE|nr:hypothetical protein AAFF_G00154260 [Aldrovandia affinis]